MKLAAIDIGSNAIRFQLTNVLEYDNQVNFKKMEYIRFPLRLGHDTFTINKISPESEARFIKLMHALKLLIELYQVDDYMICATSAMREASNGQLIADKVMQEFGMNIQIIDGIKEADLISTSIRNIVDEHNFIHIDVGGGSTELNFYVKQHKVDTRSFKVGSVRRLEKLDSPENWKEMENWVEENRRKFKGPILAIGTGGNISKLFELTKTKPGKGLSIKKLLDVQRVLKKFTYEQRLNILKLNPDRADVIIPASDIYISVMNWAKAKKIFVPDAGLKDGMILWLYERMKAGEKSRLKMG